MREFYRPRETELEMMPVDVGTLAEQVLELTQARWRDMAQQHGISIEARAELGPGLPRITGLESELREALTNLVLNAVDAMTRGGVLTVRTRLLGDPARSARSVAIEVVDEGDGMRRRRASRPGRRGRPLRC